MIKRCTEAERHRSRETATDIWLRYKDEAERSDRKRSYPASRPLCSVPAFLSKNLVDEAIDIRSHDATAVLALIAAREGQTSLIPDLQVTERYYTL